MFGISVIQIAARKVYEHIFLAENDSLKHTVNVAKENIFQAGILLL
jgi:hypothetical protein